MIDFYGLRFAQALGVHVGDAELALVKHAQDNEELRFALDLVEPHQRWIVAGGGLGWTSARLAHTIGADKVKTYEPNKLLVDAVARYVRITFSALDVEHAALSIDDGEMTFYQHENWGISTLEEVRSKPDSSSMTVRTVGISSAVAAFDANALLLDIEGHEHVVQDAINHEQRLRTLVVEVHGHVERFQARMANGGWRIVRLSLDSSGNLAVFGAVR